MVEVKALAERLNRSEVDLWVDLFTALDEAGEDRFGPLIRRFGDTVALHVDDIRVPHFNRVLGLCPNDMGYLRDIARFYRERACPYRIDVSPFRASLDLMDEITNLGLQPADFQTSVYGRLPTGLAWHNEISVEEATPEQASTFARLFETAYHGPGTPEHLANFRRASVRARFGRAGWHFFIGYIDAVPAGGAVLYVKDGVASLGGGATLPQFRGRGCQSALITERLAAAAAMGCDLVVSRCAVGSASQRNLERAGLGTAYTKVIWQSRFGMSERKIA